MTQVRLEVTVSEGENASLACNYTTTYAPSLLWYRRGPSHQLDYLLQVDSRGVRYGQDGSLSHLGAQLDTEQQTALLQIHATQLSDSAVYFCALSHTGQQHHPPLVQEPPTAQPFSRLASFPS